MNNKEVCSLVLRTSQGIHNLSNTICEWYNIDLRILLGDMYDKYEKFNLTIESISCGYCGTALGETLNNLTTQIFIEGLPFINNCYNSERNLNTNIALLTNFHFIRDFPQILNQSNNSSLTFSKNQEKANIKISLFNLDNVLCQTTGVGGPYPHIIYSFKIYGVENSNYENSTIKKIF